MAVLQTKPRLSEAEYLVIERAAAYKSEFFDGEMFAMAGGSLPHSRIATNLAIEIGNRLKGRPCVPFNSDLRLKVEASGLITYPDLSVICGPIEFASGSDDTVSNPTVIVEVLSPSTEAYDRGAKFDNYRRMPSLQEYLLVSQDAPRVEQFIRQSGGDWLLRVVAGLESSIELPSLNISLPLAEVFAGVEFNPSPLRPAAPPRK